MEDVGARGDDYIDQFHLNHIADHLAHPARNHRTRQPQEDDALGITEHLSENFKAFKNIPALKRGVLKGLNQIEKVLDAVEIEMPDRFFKNF